MRRLLIVACWRFFVSSHGQRADADPAAGLARDAVTPADMTERLEKAAMRTKKSGAERRGARIVDRFLLAVECRKNISAMADRDLASAGNPSGTRPSGGRG